MKYFFSVLVFWWFAATVLGQQYNVVVTEKDWVMAPEAATVYMMTSVAPLLDKAIRDPSYPIGISKRVTLLFTQIQDGKIEYRAEPFYRPTSKDTLAHVDWDAKQNKPVLMVFMPAVRDLRAKAEFQNSDNFELLMAITFAHEYVHIERDKYHPMKLRAGTYSPQIAQKDEAEAWGITILEMIRPALQQHRWLPENLRHNSKELKKAKDNYDDPGWIAAYANYPGQ
jgi:hypothetical protein